MPIVERIAEDATRASDMIFAENPEMIEHFSRTRREIPRYTAFFYALSRKENELLNIAPNEAASKGPARTPVFGSVGRLRDAWAGRGRGFATYGIAIRVGDSDWAEWRVRFGTVGGEGGAGMSEGG